MPPLRVFVACAAYVRRDFGWPGRGGFHFRSLWEKQWKSNGKEEMLIFAGTDSESHASTR
jgi:hypothetical protein